MKNIMIRNLDKVHQNNIILIDFGFTKKYI